MFSHSLQKFKQHLVSWLYQEVDDIPRVSQHRFVNLALSVPFALGLSGSSIPAQALPVLQSMFSSQAQGLGGANPTITVWPGEGTNLSVILTGETIQKAWLDDPSHLSLDFDGQMCSPSNSTESSSNSDNKASKKDCSKSSVQVVHLREIKPIKFPALLNSSTTLLTLVTTGPQGRHLYSFRIVYGTGVPQYHTFAIYPDPRSAAQSFSQANEREEQLSAIKRGLAIAESKRWVNRQSPIWNRIQSFIALNGSGVSVNKAAQRAGISTELVDRLSDLGKANTAMPLSPLP